MVMRSVIQRARARRDQRGAAIFVVMLVIVMLTGIGVFASRSAILTTTTSGATRQMTQTHYVTEYALGLTMGELSSKRKQAYVLSMTKPPNGVATPGQNPCFKGLPSAPSTDYVLNPTCYRFGYADLKQQVVSGGGLAAGGDLLEPTIPNADPSQTIPGSLGYANLEASFLVEMTDLAPASPPVAGMDLASSSIQYYAVTLTATGQVRPKPSGNQQVDLGSATAAGVDTLRSHVVVGPLPKL